MSLPWSSFCENIGAAVHSQFFPSERGQMAISYMVGHRKNQFFVCFMLIFFTKTGAPNFLWQVTNEVVTEKDCSSGAE